MSLADALTVAEEFRAQFVALEQDLRGLDYPAQYLLAANEAQGPNAPATQAGRRATAELAVTLNPLVKVQLIDGEHAMMLTHPHEVAKAVIELDSKF